MKIYDISQEVFSCTVYPGDSAPKATAVRRTAAGDLYNLTDFSMCAHNGTHVDAPFHFLGDGKTVDQIPLEKTVGCCTVAFCEGDLTREKALTLLASASLQSQKRILLKGNATVTEEGAKTLAEAGIFLIGVESQSVGEGAEPMEVHKILLSEEIVLLEGLRLSSVAPGEYFLAAQPLNLAASDGAPCRAVLIK